MWWENGWRWPTVDKICDVISLPEIESKNGWNFQQKYTIFSRRAAAAEQNRRKIVIWDLGFFWKLKLLTTKRIKKRQKTQFSHK
jgi:hypothetical protein